VITQTADPCLSSLSAAAPSNPTFAYDAVTTIETIGGWSLFVANSDAANCPVTSCSIYDGSSSCLISYLGGQLSVASTDPFTITANKNVQAGWTETVCVACINGAGQWVATNNFVIT